MPEYSQDPSLCYTLDELAALDRLCPVLGAKREDWHPRGNYCVIYLGDDGAGTEYLVDLYKYSGCFQWSLADASGTHNPVVAVSWQQGQTVTEALLHAFACFKKFFYKWQPDPGQPKLADGVCWLQCKYD